MIVLPRATNSFVGLNVLNSPAYCAFTSVNPLLVLRKAVPGVVNSTPRGEFTLKKLPGKRPLFVNAAGTPSQLISRRLPACSPATLGLSAPRSVR
jgi:hypothetical protein